MNNFFKYFQFNTVERNGFIVLTVLVVLLNCTVFVYQLLKSTEEMPHKMYNLIDIESFVAYEVEKDQVFSKPYSNYNKTKNVVSYFKFDPNTLSADEWSKLGLSEKQIHVIMNYRTKGGKFYKKEDLRKIYSITKRDYNRLQSYVEIKISTEKPNKSFESSTFDNNEIKPKVRTISINTADTAEFKKLHGIGAVLANRIVKFRDALGGFYSPDQIKEVYGISEETYLNIKDKLIVSSGSISKLKINESNYEQLAKHPYINNKQAQLIINFRQQHGAFANLESLSKIKALDQEFLRKIEPYLDF